MFNKITKTDTGYVIIDELTRTDRLRQLDEYIALYPRARDMLAKNNIEFSHNYVRGVVHFGSQRLRQLIRTDARTAARNMGMPPHMLDAWADRAEYDVNEVVWDAADAIHADENRARDGLPVAESDLTVDPVTDTWQIDRDSIIDRIMLGTSLPVTEEMMADADALYRIAQELRGLELKGVNALELIERWCTADEEDAPDEPARAFGIATRRHEPGRILHPDVIRILNNITMQNVLIH